MTSQDCTCSEAQIAKVGCDCRAERTNIVDVGTQRLENGLYVLTFDGVMRGDCAKFDYREARTAAASWDGKEGGDWKFVDGVATEWVPSVYRCAWGAGLTS